MVSKLHLRSTADRRHRAPRRPRGEPDRRERPSVDPACGEMSALIDDLQRAGRADRQRGHRSHRPASPSSPGPPTSMAATPRWATSSPTPSEGRRAVVTEGGETPVIAFMNPGGIRADLVENDGRRRHLRRGVLGAAVQQLHGLLGPDRGADQDLLNEQWNGANEAPSKILQVVGPDLHLGHVARREAGTDALVGGGARRRGRDGTAGGALDSRRPTGSSATTSWPTRRQLRHVRRGDRQVHRRRGHGRIRRYLTANSPYTPPATDTSTSSTDLTQHRGGPASAGPPFLASVRPMSPTGVSVGSRAETKARPTSRGRNGLGVERSGGLHLVRHGEWLRSAAAARASFCAWRRSTCASRSPASGAGDGSPPPGGPPPGGGCR